MRASDRVYHALREEIVAWRLAPGVELSEVEQAERWGVSRTPLREALSRLVADGLAVTGRGRTLVVSGLDADDVQHLFELREALETQAARLAARRGDRATFLDLRDRFAAAPALLHDGGPGLDGYYAVVADLDAAVDEAMASPHLRRSLAGLRPHVARVRRFAQGSPARLVRAADEHRLIAAAIADHDEVLAAQATAVHLRASLETVLAGVHDLTAGSAPHGPALATAVGSAPDGPAPAPAASPAPATTLATVAGGAL